MIGFERKRKVKDAGIRTHSLIALGAALVMIVSKYGFFDLLSLTKSNWSLDPSRIAAQVVSGIGFLGAGTILNRHNRIIDGLTTAAGIWVTGGIGLAFGSGLYSIGLISTFFVLGAELLGRLFDQIAENHHHRIILFIRMTGSIADICKLQKELDQKFFVLPSDHVLYNYDGQAIAFRIYGHLRPHRKMNDLFTYLMKNDQIIELEVD
ncbi:MgtC/SapB family protein [Ligilactobacillus faecis]